MFGANGELTKRLAGNAVSQLWTVGGEWYGNKTEQNLQHQAAGRAGHVDAGPPAERHELLAFRAVHAAHAVAHLNVMATVVVGGVPDAVIRIVAGEIAAPRLAHPQAVTGRAVGARQINRVLRLASERRGQFHRDGAAVVEDHFHGHRFFQVVQGVAHAFGFDFVLVVLFVHEDVHGVAEVGVRALLAIQLDDFELFVGLVDRFAGRGGQEVLELQEPAPAAQGATPAPRDAAKDVSVPGEQDKPDGASGEDDKSTSAADSRQERQVEQKRRQDDAQAVRDAIRAMKELLAMLKSKLRMQDKATQKLKRGLKEV